MIAVINLAMPHLRKRIFSVIQQKQNGKCHHCKRNITLSDSVVINGKGRSYYHKSCAENCISYEEGYIISYEERQSAMGQLKSVFPEFRLEHLDANASLSGYPAYKIDYSYVINTQEGPIKIKNLQVWTISGDNAYILTFGMESSKYSDYAPLIDDMINSFKLVQSQTGALNT